VSDDSTDPESSAHDPGAKVISGEATPPDEHTRRVAAMKKQKDQATLIIHGRNERTLPDVEAANDTLALTPRAEKRVEERRIEEKPPAKEHKRAPEPPPAEEPLPERRPPEPQPKEEAPPQVSEPSSRALAERSLRERRRARDRRAERAALGAVLLVFAVVGVALYAALNSDLLNGDAETKPRDPALEAQRREAEAKAQRDRAEQKKREAGRFEETSDLPALRSLANEGLTIAAEGIPEVLAADSTSRASVLAAIETCRFAYGVWEFSPNKRFRFMTTCGGLEGQTLVGAYEVHGSTIKMSPLIDGATAIVSIFEVEKPSKLTSQLLVKEGEASVELRVNQIVTTIRPGLHGEAFHDTFAPANTLSVPGMKKSSPSEPVEKKPARDPLLDLIKKNGR
jgi:hypothetical protein